MNDSGQRNLKIHIQGSVKQMIGIYGIIWQWFKKQLKFGGLDINIGGHLRNILFHEATHPLQPTPVANARIGLSGASGQFRHRNHPLIHEENLHIFENKIHIIEATHPLVCRNQYVIKNYIRYLQLWLASAIKNWLYSIPHPYTLLYICV